MVGVLGTEILGWMMYIAISFATYSVPDVLQSNFELPIADVFLNALGKKGTLALWWSITVLQVGILLIHSYVPSQAHLLSICADVLRLLMHPEWCLPSPGMTHCQARGGGSASTDIHRPPLTPSGLLYCFL